MTQFHSIVCWVRLASTAAVLINIVLGYVSIEAAVQDYGVVVRIWDRRIS